MNSFTYMDDRNFSKGRYYLGASDVPTIALMNLKYGQTPLTLWETLTGRREPWKGNERTKAGSDLEVTVLKWALEKMDYDQDFITEFLISRLQGKESYKNLHSWTEAECPGYPFLKAHADLIDVDSEMNVEAKAHGLYGAKRGDDLDKGYDKDDMSANGIPASIYLQLQTQALCYVTPRNRVSAMIDTGIHRLYESIKPHKKTQESILAITERFWWHVEKDKSPKPETWKDIVRLNPNLDKTSKTMISGADEIKVKVMKDRAKFLRTKKTDVESELKDLKNAVGLILGENRTLENDMGDGLASQFDVIRYSLKNSKDMTKGRFNKLIKDGFITKSEYRDMRF